MNIQRNLKIGTIVMAAALGTMACSTTGGQMASAPTVVSQPSVQAADAAVQPSTTVVASAQDGLHQDRRWPSFANCINNTATQEAFISCLRTAFLQDGTGTEIALLGHGSAAPAPTALAGTSVVAGK